MIASWIFPFFVIEHNWKLFSKYGSPYDIDHVRLYDEMKIEIQDLLQIKIPQWVMRPFESSIDTIAIELQDHLTDILNDTLFYYTI